MHPAGNWDESEQWDGGEAAEMSGEASSRTNIQIPETQRDLIKALLKTGKPVVLVLFTGRPRALKW